MIRNVPSVPIKAAGPIITETAMIQDSNKKQDEMRIVPITKASKMR